MKFISINIEGNKHLELVLPFLISTNPDILCIQEIFEPDLASIQSLGYHISFAPMTLKSYEQEVHAQGIATATKIAHTTRVEYYHGDASRVTHYESSNKQGTIANPLLITEIETGNGPMMIVNTHFPWTNYTHREEGADVQPEALQRLLEITDTLPPHVLCGDFNIPRNGSPLYNILASAYQDTIPKTYTSSLDKTLHRCGADPTREELFTNFMVDYLFTKPPYVVSDVTLNFGVSDHAAVSATIEKTS